MTLFFLFLFWPAGWTGCSIEWELRLQSMYDMCRAGCKTESGQDTSHICCALAAEQSESAGGPGTRAGSLASLALASLNYFLLFSPFLFLPSDLALTCLTYGLGWPIIAVVIPRLFVRFPRAERDAGDVYFCRS